MCRRLDIDIPTLVDNMENTTSRAYDVTFDRLYLIDAQGRVAYQGAPEPSGFDPAGLEAAIKKHLARTKA